MKNDAPGLFWLKTGGILTRAAGSVTRYCGFFRRSQTETVLDYGAGTLRNSLNLARSGFTVYAADLPELFREFLEIMAGLHAAGKTIVMASHDALVCESE